MPENPFRSYESSNAIDVTLYFGENSRRSFRLAHAITGEFVESLYKGLDDEEIKRKADKKEKIVSELGGLWLNSHASRTPLRKARWQEFLTAKSATVERNAIISAIYDELRTGLCSTGVLKQIATCGGEIAGDVAYYLHHVEDLDFISTFWHPRNTECPHGITSVAFQRDIRLLYQALGFGRMYSLCGHFHADLGMFEASPDMGTFGIAVGGMQPGKLIGSEISAYILKCSHERDELWRLAKPDPAITNEQGFDLSHDIPLNASHVMHLEQEVLRRVKRDLAALKQL
jgi:hypothetical protein